MNTISEVLLILSLKLILIVGFILLIKFWFKKKESGLPVITYWVFGFFLVWVLTAQILNWLLMEIFYIVTQKLSSDYPIASIGSIIGLIIYILIGNKYFKRKTKPSNPTM